MNLEYNITKASEREFILSFKEANYLVGEVVYTLLKGLKQGDGIEKITNTIKHLKGYEKFTVNDVNSLIDTKITPLLEQDEIVKKENPVKSLFTVFNPKNHAWIFKRIKVIFAPTFFWISFLVLIAFSLTIMITEDNLVSSLAELKLGWGFTVLFSVIVILFHEIGHVTAASYYNEMPKKVGFGIYFIYPAFFTDLSTIWKLNKKQRIIINLGGIYFQLLFNIILAILMNVVPQYRPLWISMLFANMSIIFFNLNPLFKFDAYWIFSDYFEIPNLREQSLRTLSSFIGKATMPPIEKKKKLILIIYSVFFLAFMAFVWFAISRFLFVGFRELISEYNTYKFTRITQFEIIKKLLFFIFILVLSTRMVSSLFIKKSN